MMRNSWAKYVFPLICALGGMMLLTHSALHRKRERTAAAGNDPHAAGRVCHLVGLDPLAGVAPGDGRAQVIAGWLWPTFFCLTALTLLLYREI